jgi:Na+/phosphate symporter
MLESLEKEKDLQNSIDKYQELLKLNNIIEKKFQKNSKIINEETKKKIHNISKKKNAK